MMRKAVCEHDGAPQPTRRRFLAAGAAAAVAPALARAQSGNVSIGIVGAGLAGLACAYELQKLGYSAKVYEWNARVGGRCWSDRGTFPGQVAELGGEFIDTLGKTMLGYAQEFKLTLEDVNKQPGSIFYSFDIGGRRLYTEQEIVAEIRAFVPAIQDDLRRLSSAPTAENHTAVDVQIDNMSLEQYLVSRGVGPIAYKAIRYAYIGEYGLEIDRQSCLNFVLYMRANRRSRFQPFGVSDQRYHIVEGNDAVAAGLYGRVSSQVMPGMRLTKVAKTSAGQIALTFGNKTVYHDVAVLAIPFTTLRDVVLDASLGLPPWKTYAIQNLGYGMNAKRMLGFKSRPWAAAGGNGTTYADLPEIQNTWETNPARATSSRAVLTNYTGGNLGAAVGNVGLHTVDAFLNDLEYIFPGSKTAANKAQTVLQHWPSVPWTKGSYTCYLPGQFTSIAGNEGKPVGNLYFAGEHANSFYEWQGFMEGAALSGVDAARQIWKAVRK